MGRQGGVPAGPLLGRAFGACAIYVDRHDPSAARSTLDDALAALPPGWSVGLFPEGTRSRDGELQTFKKGAVHLALQLGLPIVPIGVAAPTEVVPYGPRTFEPGVVEIDVGPPLPTGGWTADDVGARTAELRTAVAACVERARARLA